MSGEGVLFFPGIFFSFFLFSPRCDLLRNTGLPGSEGGSEHFDDGHNLQLRIPKSDCLPRLALRSWAPPGLWWDDSQCD